MQRVIDVVVRCRNESPQMGYALSALERQVRPAARVLFLDCGSTDGSREAARAAGVKIIDIDPARYVPGAALNLGMRETRSDVVAFVNADAVALAPDTLARLSAPLVEDPRVGAAFGRQIPRPEATKTTRLDHERAFGPERVLAPRRGGFFSMAASAIRRRAWEGLPFDEALRFSEDVDWTERASALGWEIVYAPSARFEKSREYSVTGHFRRREGEGFADCAIHRLGRPAWIGELVRPLAGSLFRDARALALSPESLVVRVAQASGYFVGRWRGRRAWSR